MQVLLLQLGGQHYALETRDVVRILPAMRLVSLPRAPAFIAGIMNLHGAPVPVLDLTLIGAIAGIESLTTEAPSAVQPATAASEIWHDTRIILVAHRLPDGGTCQLGLRAEHVTGTRDIDPDRIIASGVHDAETPFLGKLVADAQPMLQLIDLAQLLPPQVSRWLVGRVAEAPC